MIETLYSLTLPDNELESGDPYGLSYDVLWK